MLHTKDAGLYPALFLLMDESQATHPIPLMFSPMQKYTFISNYANNLVRNEEISCQNLHMSEISVTFAVKN